MINFRVTCTPDGRCKTFDAADGKSPAAAASSSAPQRRHPRRDLIRAVIRGSAVNQDGASGGLTVPNGRAQQRVITDALRQAGVEPQDVDYLEAHGTGTSLGDPIEVQAAAAALGPGRDKPLQIGSVKTNIGHLEAASIAAYQGGHVLELTLQHLHTTPHIPGKLPVRCDHPGRPAASAASPASPLRLLGATPMS
jgi:acyl transferase domain-containing protein